MLSPRAAPRRQGSLQEATPGGWVSQDPAARDGGWDTPALRSPWARRLFLAAIGVALACSAQAMAIASRSERRYHLVTAEGAAPQRGRGRRRAGGERQGTGPARWTPRPR